MFHLREAFRSGDIWLAQSRRYADLKDALVPIATAQATSRLMVPFDPADWLANRKSRMARALKRLAQAAKAGAIPGGSIENGALKIERNVFGFWGQGNGDDGQFLRKGNSPVFDAVALVGTV